MFFVSVVKRLQSLCAMPHADRSAADLFINLSDFDLENEYGEKSLTQMVNIIVNFANDRA
jgi:hypothetical protein